MNILVCIKSDISGEEIGPFEALALEAGLCLKEACGGGGQDPAQLDAITVGPSDRVGILRRALGLGADKGIHILTPMDEGGAGIVPASVTSALLARAISHPEFTPFYDLVLTGVMSQDLMAGQTGPMTAELLDLALATAVVDLSFRDNGLTATREWEGGVREVLDIPLPALVSIQAGEYTPRYPRLSDMLKAKSRPIQTLTPEMLGLTDKELAVHENALELLVPEKTRAGELLDGSLRDQVCGFKRFLKERALT